MKARIGVTKRLRKGYARATKSEKSQVLDNFCVATGLCRSTARRYLTSETAGRTKVMKLDQRKCKASKYSAAAKLKLVWLWRCMGMPCGKYLVAGREQWIGALEAHGELVPGLEGWTKEVKQELLSMSAATIDRYLKKERKLLELKGLSATKPGALLRNAITVRKAGDEMEQDPGFFEVDTVAHCGPTLKGEFARTLTLTDVQTGWIQLEVLRNNARVHMLGGLERALAAIPFWVQGLDFDNGSEFINHDVISWAAKRQIYFTRARPYHKNDQAQVESKNNHAVRKYGFYYRYDTEEERQSLAELWQRVTLKLNFFMPTKKPVGWTEDKKGRRKRIYDTPATPFERLLTANVLSTTQIQELLLLRDSINPLELTRNILRYQNNLTRLASEKTQVLTDQLTQRRQKALEGGFKCIVQ